MINKLLKTLTACQITISRCALISVIAINAVEILLRYTMGKSLYWIQDVSLLFMVWMIFPGVTKIVYDKKDISVTLLVEKFPASIRKLIDVLTYILIFVFFLLLSKYSYNLLIGQIGNKTATVGIPLVYYTAAVLLNCISVAAIYLYELYEIIVIQGKEETA